MLNFHSHSIFFSFFFISTRLNSTDAHTQFYLTALGFRLKVGISLHYLVVLSCRMVTCKQEEEKQNENLMLHATSEIELTLKKKRRKVGKKVENIARERFLNINYGDKQILGSEKCHII